MTKLHDKSAAALLKPSIAMLRTRERRASPEERLREAAILAVLNADCPHQSCISVADAESIADAVLATL